MKTIKTNSLFPPPSSSPSQVKALSPSTSAFFVSTDEDAGRILCMAQVPKDAVAKGLKANEWVGQVQALIGGRGGGKPESAQATGQEVGAAAEALRVAEAYAREKLGVAEPVVVKEAAAE